MKYGSVCSGVEAATVAWHDLGWEPQFFSEIEAFPSAVLKHHYPDVPNYGDMTKYKDWNLNDKSIDLLVGGTPCQSFSVAGLRKGLDDPRGNLMLTYLAVARKYRPKWLVWENVPGVLSSNRGRDFGTFLSALGQSGYGFAYRVLDAQYFGVAQRRRRVFVVGYLGDWRRAAAVLFERESMSGHPAPSREKREKAAKCLTSRVGQAYDAETEQFVTKFVPSHDKVGTLTASYGMGGADIETKPVVFGAQNSASQGDSVSEHVTPTLDKSKTPAVAFDAYNQTVSDKAAALRTAAGGVYDNTVMTPAVAWSIMSMNSGKDYKARVTDVAQPLMASGPVGGNQGGDFVQQFAPRRQEGEKVAPTVTQGVAHQVAIPINTMTVQGRPSDDLKPRMGLGIGEPGDPCPTITSAHSHAVGSFHQTADCLTSAYGTKWNGNGSATNGSLFANHDMAVRRLTPTECERLQGFPDGYTNIKDKCPDGPRYKALGNSMAVPVMKWIGERIQMVEDTA